MKSAKGDDAAIDAPFGLSVATGSDRPNPRLLAEGCEAHRFGLAILNDNKRWLVVPSYKDDVNAIQAHADTVRNTANDFLSYAQDQGQTRRAPGPAAVRVTTARAAGEK